jgi:hypothetical protein
MTVALKYVCVYISASPFIDRYGTQDRRQASCTASEEGGGKRSGCRQREHPRFVVLVVELAMLPDEVVSINLFSKSTNKSYFPQTYYPPNTIRHAAGREGRKMSSVVIEA